MVPNPKKYLTFTAKKGNYGRDVIKSKLNPILWLGKDKEVFFFYEEPAEDDAAPRGII